MKNWLGMLVIGLSAFTWVKGQTSKNKTINHGSIILNRLILYSFPLLNNEDQPWDPIIPVSDPNGYPDIVVYITGTSGKPYADLSGSNYTKYNANPYESPYIFNIYATSDIIDLSDTLILTFYDDDMFDSDDLMGTLFFPVRQISSNFLSIQQSSVLHAAIEADN